MENGTSNKEQPEGCPMGGFCPLGKMTQQAIGHMASIADDVRGLKQEMLKTMRFLIIVIAVISVIFIVQDRLQSIKGFGAEASFAADGKVK